MVVSRGGEPSPRRRASLEIVSPSDSSATTLSKGADSLASLSPAMKSFLVCCFYGFTSGALALLNKSILSSYHFNGYMMILSAQMGLQMLLCIVTRDFMGNPFSVPNYDRSAHMFSLRMGVTGVLNVVIGFMALQMVNVPMFLCIRRLVAPVILLYEFVFFGKVADPNVQVAVGAILVGTLVAGYESLESDLRGFFVTFLNNIFSAAVSMLLKNDSIHINKKCAYPLTPLPPHPPPLALTDKCYDKGIFCQTKSWCIGYSIL
jgi:hypothetical protein